MEIWKRTCQKISKYEYFVSDMGRVARRINGAHRGADTSVLPYIQIAGKLCKLLNPYNKSISNQKNIFAWHKRIGKETQYYSEVQINGCLESSNTRNRCRKGVH